ncbi:NlpC/P60 family protein [Oribacterium sp. NK2B42]|uniref:NlpC/P60 family protein n=1 Tax=Oribacterium sp. NK2B42 TaxID=689781 RepID=UPI000403F4DC|nr:NlpC/P60 family protein [Oribacterium sp. NK2B42]
MKKYTYKHLALYTALAMTLSATTPGMVSFAEEAKKSSSVTAIVEAVSVASTTKSSETKDSSSKAKEAANASEDTVDSTIEETKASKSSSTDSKSTKTSATETSAANSGSDKTETTAASSTEASSTSTSATSASSEEVLLEIGDGPVDDAELGITSDEDLAALTDGSMIPEYNITSIDETTSNVVTENYAVAKDSSAAETTTETSSASGSEDKLLEMADDVDEFSAFKTTVSKVAESVTNFVSNLTGRSTGTTSVTANPSGSDDTVIAANTAPSSETTSVVSAPKKTVNAGTAVPTIATTASRQALINYAKQFLGNPYVFGGTSLTDGADCSGFVQQIFKNFGIKTGRSSRDQLDNAQSITFEELQPGDLIFYASGDYVNHVAIYAGDGVIIHAANSRTGICTGKYDYREPYAYGRFINN